DRRISADLGVSRSSDLDRDTGGVSKILKAVGVVIKDENNLASRDLLGRVYYVAVDTRRVDLLHGAVGELMAALA
ncbi:hypothetical protein, partial [Candidatus Frankia alpina]|uniref:hypothetical protein n=1 Tax=Candidatus Frankia alpina TaxID=2699483 RepID=UPI001A98D248